MTTLTLQLQESVARAVEKRAASEGKNLDQYVADVLARDVGKGSLDALKRIWQRADREGWKGTGGIMLSDDEMYLR